MNIKLNSGLHMNNSRQYLGVDHRGSCCYARGSTCVCTAAANLQGCTCGRDRSAGPQGSLCIGFCWSALPLLDPPLMATLRRETVVVFNIKTTITLATEISDSYLCSAVIPSVSKCVDPSAGTQFSPESQREHRQQINAS